MNNPIADPLVEGPDTDSLSTLVTLEATPDGVATVVINRADHRNALNAEVIGALREAFETLEGADGIRVVFVRGAGGVFSVGADPEAARDAGGYTEAENREDAMSLATTLHALSRLPMLTVALVEGEAFGDGAGLAAACDMAIATADAKFAFPEVRLGLVAAVISPYLVAAAGPRRVKARLARGGAFDAEAARGDGLVDSVVADARALEEAKEAIIKDAMASAPGAVAESKRLVDHLARREIDHALMTDMAHWTARTRAGPEAAEGVSAFLDGRPPRWML